MPHLLPANRPVAVRAACLVAVAAACIASVTWPFLLPGELVWRDMVVPADMALSPANFGGGDLPARALPQDGLLALAAQLVPAHWLVRALVIGSAGAAAWGGWRLTRLCAPAPRHSSEPVVDRRLLGPAAAIAVCVLNPLVVERLLQGQWSIAVAAWLGPAIAAAGLAGRRPGQWAAMFVSSLTPTGALTGALMGIATARRRLATALYGLALCLPWALPGLLGVVRGTAPGMDAAAAVAAFAPRAEAHAGLLVTVLGLGGVWNAEAVPASRQAGFALFGVLLIAVVALGWARLSRPGRGAGSLRWPAGGGALLVLAALGLGGVLLGAVFPGPLAWVVDTVPGGGLLRDSQKFLALAVPAYAVGLGAVRGPSAAAGLVAVALLVPDAARAVAPLQPRPAGTDSALVRQLGGRDTLFADRPELVEVPGGVAVDPYAKVAAKVQSGALRVDGAVVDYPAPRWVATQRAWQDRDLRRLERLGVGAVVEGGQIVAETDAGPQPRPWGLVVAWLLTPLAARLIVRWLYRSRARANP
ncbi:hypothetical protein [Corynebacterium confusum]